MVALIPARAGSKRCPGKNTRLLAGHPLLAYTIAAAQQSGLFSLIWVSTDSQQTAGIALMYGAGVRLVGPPCHTDSCRDITWVKDALATIKAGRPDTFAILRPTSPFRTAATIRRAWDQFWTADGTHDSLRAVEPVKHTPYKMWTYAGPGYPIKPLLDGKHDDGTPWHSSPTQSLPQVYIQNASLEMSWTSNVETHGTISGRKIIPFFTSGYEAFDINTEADFREAERLAASGEATLPPISLAALSGTAPPL